MKQFLHIFVVFSEYMNFNVSTERFFKEFAKLNLTISHYSYSVITLSISSIAFKNAMTESGSSESWLPFDFDTFLAFLASFESSFDLELKKFVEQCFAFYLYSFIFV